MSGYGLFTGGLGFQYGAERLGALTIPSGSGNSKRQIHLMQDFSTTVVHVIPSYALHLWKDLINHGSMKGLAFLAAGALLYLLFIKAGDHHSPLTVSDLSGAARKYPVVAFTLSVAVLGLAGLPPFAGFMSKWQIFAAGVETQNIAIELLVLFAALNSILSLAYYAPIVNAVYRQEPSEAVARGQAMSWTMSLPLILLAVAIVILGIWPSLLAWMTGPAGVDLVRAFGG